ncbi:MAG: triose-phosphate transporter family protein [Coriobacteriales bacterium]|jgi:multidrug transporter EmrE-like cation transporter|nr:triose-phosphate transporter family protein [Coriobacteriales bacterium]
MPENIVFLLIMVLSVFVSSVSQVMLKIAASKDYSKRIYEYLNPLVISAYLLFFGSTVVTVIAYRHVALSLGPIVEALGYVFIAILSYMILKERINTKKLVGLALIICGVVVVAI